MSNKDKIVEILDKELVMEYIPGNDYPQISGKYDAAIAISELFPNEGDMVYVEVDASKELPNELEFYVPQKIKVSSERAKDLLFGKKRIEDLHQYKSWLKKVTIPKQVEEEEIENTALLILVENDYLSDLDQNIHLSKAIAKAIMKLIEERSGR